MITPRFLLLVTTDEFVIGTNSPTENNYEAKTHTPHLFRGAGEQTNAGRTQGAPFLKEAAHLRSDVPEGTANSSLREVHS